MCLTRHNNIWLIYIKDDIYASVSLNTLKQSKEMANLGICYSSLEIRSQHYLAQADYHRMLNTLIKIVRPPPCITQRVDVGLFCYV